MTGRLVDGRPAAGRLAVREPGAATGGPDGAPRRGEVGLHGVGVRFGDVEVLRGIDLTVAPGEIVTVVGVSGGGKSTLLDVVAGVRRPTSGTVRVGGKVALMFQDATLLPWLTATQNVALALRLRGVPRAQRRAQAIDLLTEVGLAGHLDHRPHQLSGGMRQRVALARVLAQDAPVVLMDEPMAALDRITRESVHHLLESVCARSGLTVLFVTHDVQEAVRLGDRVLVLGGRPGTLLAEHVVDLPRPRAADSTEVTRRAAAVAADLHRADPQHADPQHADPQHDGGRDDG